MKTKKTIFVLLFVCITLTVSCGKPTVRMDSDSVKGKLVEEVVNTLSKDGFTNIEKVEIDDLSYNGSTPDGIVESITIDGKESFSIGETFDPDVKVEIKYHTYKRIQAPMVAGEIDDNTLEDIKKAFEDTGFLDVSVVEYYDLDPDLYDKEYSTDVSIGNEALGTDNQRYPYDAEVIISRHYPFEKYNLSLDIDFIGNWFFSKYDVILKVDDSEVTVMDHGNDWSGNVNLKEGDHTITFYKSGDSTVNGSIKCTIKSDTEASFRISCYNDKVSVETIYYDEKLSDDMVRMTGSEFSYMFKNYNDVLNELKQLGFNNFSLVPVYDIVWGITEVGEIESVSIDGSRDYKRGDKFKKSAEVEVVYHMLAEDDPNPTSAYSDSSKEQEMEQRIEEEIVDRSYVYARDWLNKEGYIAQYEHAYTHQDFTGSLDFYTDEELIEDGWIVTGIKEVDYRSNSVVVYIDTEGNIAAREEINSLQETLERNFDPAVAMAALEVYGKKKYPYGFKLHMVTGKIAETAVDENTWFMKYNCQITNSSGNKIETVCEGRIRGPESNPTVIYFYVY